MAERINRDIPLGPLDVQVPDLRAEPGVVRLIQNLISRGPTEAPVYSPAETPELVYERDDVEDELGQLEGVRAMHIQVRQRIGELADLATVPDQSRERLVVATNAKIYILDPAENYDLLEVYEWPASLAGASKRLQFDQVGDVTFISVALGGGLGTPGPVLVLVDDQVMPLDLPALPYMSITENASGGILDAGTYGVRYAWLLKDGTVASSSRPYAVTVSANAELQFAISSYVTTPASYWSKIIAGVQVCISQAASGSDPVELMNTPYFRVANVVGLQAGASAAWSDTDENILSYPVFDDTSQLIHQLRAASVKSYNKRLIIGDVAVNFRPPDVVAQSPDGSSGGDTNQVPTATEWLQDTDDDGNPTDPSGVDHYFLTEDGGATDVTLAVEFEDPDGLIVRGEHIPLSEEPGERIPVYAIRWEYDNAGTWDPIAYGLDVADLLSTPGTGQAKIRFRIEMAFGPEHVGTWSFVLRIEDDDFGYIERTYSITILSS